MGLDNGEGVIETQSGGTWTVREAPLPKGASTQAYGQLDAVDCPAAGSCVAVGSYNEGASNRYAGLIETLSGTSWTATGASLPHDTGPNDPALTVSGIAKSAAGSCVAVGGYTDKNGHFQGLIETVGIAGLG